MASTADHHEHLFLGQAHHDGENATRLVLALTIVTMAAEIVGGWWTGSMALLADGWHMGMHAAAMGIAVFAYRFAHRHRHSDRYSFGTGKVGELAAFANAVMLAVIAVLIAGESAERLVSPVAIDFRAALVVAVIGLGVNLVSAWILRDEPHEHGCDHHHHDTNRHAAFVHVLSDALTSALAIVALFCGRRFGWVWMDAATGLLGAAIILRWAYTLARTSGDVLLDATPRSDLPARIREIVQAHGDRIHDLHLWQIGPGHFAAIVGAKPIGGAGSGGDYHAELLALPGLSHLTLDRSGAVATGSHHPHEHHHR